MGNETFYGDGLNDLILCQGILNDSKSNLEQTRQALNEILSRLKYKTALPRDFLNNGEVIIDPLEIANQFNEYFINVGPSLAKKFNGNSQIS